MAFKPASLLVVVKEAPELIKPAEGTPSEVLWVPATDRSLLESRMLLFQAPRNPNSDLINVLKSSLRHLLVPYFPLAGRLQPSPSHGRTQLLCNAHGALLVHALSNITLNQLKQLDRTYWSELQFDFVPDGSVDVPPLLVQVTMLACGGFVLSIRLLHSLCDACGILHFLRGWSELARGDDQISTLPIWDADHLPASPSIYAPSPRRFHFPSLSLAHYRRKDYHHSVVRHDFRDHSSINRDIVVHDRRKDYQQYSVDHNDVHDFRDLVPITAISISSDEVASLARLLRKQSTRSCNTFEALAAHLWRERTRALDIPPHTQTRLFFPSPVHHDLPVVFYGQYPFNCQAIATADQLLSNDLGVALQLIQNAKASVEQDFATCVSDFAEVHAGSAACGTPPGIFIFTLLSEGVSDIDFGLGTSPAATDAVLVPSPVNVAAVVGTSPDSLEILMTNVPANLVDDMKRFIQDNIPSHSDMSRL